MIKFLIKTENKQQLQKVFTFFIKEKVELCIFPEGLKWRNSQAEGIVYKTAFAEYPFNYRRKLGKLENKPKLLQTWLKTWKDLENHLTEIPIFA